MMNPNVGFRPPIILLKDGTDSSQGKAQLISNINACQAVVEAIRTTLGPRGMDKLIHDGTKVSAGICAARFGGACAMQGPPVRVGRPRRGSAAPSLARWCSGSSGWLLGVCQQGRPPPPGVAPQWAPSGSFGWGTCASWASAAAREGGHRIGTLAGFQHWRQRTPVQSSSSSQIPLACLAREPPRPLCRRQSCAPRFAATLAAPSVRA